MTKLMKNLIPTFILILVALALSACSGEERSLGGDIYEGYGGTIVLGAAAHSGRRVVGDGTYVGVTRLSSQKNSARGIADLGGSGSGLVKFDPSLNLSTEFGMNGYTSLGFIAQSMARNSLGEIIVSGLRDSDSCYIPGQRGYEYYFDRQDCFGSLELVKVSKEGELDAGFGRVDPQLRAAIYSYESGLFKKHLSLDNQGQNIFVSGLDPASGKERIQKRLADGKLEGAFGTAGSIELDHTVFPNVTVTSSGNLMSFTDGSRFNTRWLFDPLGALIEKVEWAWRNEWEGISVMDVRYLPNGKTLVLLSERRITIPTQVAVIRLNADGTTDQTFGDGRLNMAAYPWANTGIILWHNPAGQYESNVGHMEVDSLGRIYVGVTTMCGSTNPLECSRDYFTNDSRNSIDTDKLRERATVVRMTADGDLDTSYANGGYRYGFSSAQEWLVTMNLDSNDRLTVVANLRMGNPFVLSGGGEWGQKTTGFVIGELDESGHPTK